MEDKRELRFKAICKKVVVMDADKGEVLAFMEGNEYDCVKPDIYPSPDNNICLIDHQGDEHFMDSNWFHEHFTKINI